MPSNVILLKRRSVITSFTHLKILLQLYIRIHRISKGTYYLVSFLSYGCLRSVHGTLAFLNTCQESLTNGRIFFGDGEISDSIRKTFLNSQILTLQVSSTIPNNNTREHQIVITISIVQKNKNVTLLILNHSTIFLDSYIC